MQANSTIRVLLGASAILLVSAAAMAVTGFVSPGGALTATGPIGITKGGTTISCNVVFHATSSSAAFTVPPPANVGTVNSVTLTAGSLLCGTSSATSLPWTVQTTALTYSGGSFPTPATLLSMTVKNAQVHNNSIGDCVGDVSGTFNPVNNTITIPATAMTGVNPATPCHVHGPDTSDDNHPIVLTVTPGQAVTVTAP